MDNKEERLIELISKLIELTQENKITWEAVNKNEDVLLGNAKTASAIFQADYKSKILRITKVRYERNNMQSAYEKILASISGVSSIASNPALFTKSGTHFVTRTELYFVNRHGDILWEFPRLSGVSDLYDAISFQASGIDDFIDDVLSSDN